MGDRAFFRAFVCQLAMGSGVAIVVACGGSVAPGSTSGGDGGGPPPVRQGCPDDGAIASGASLGRACASEGLYCADTSCDPCKSRACKAVGCTNGTWTPAVDTALCSGDAAPPPTGQDAAPACFTLSASEFDTSCQVDADCVSVTLTTLCAGQPQCLCGGSSINGKDQARYEALLQQIEQQLPDAGSCFGCPALGRPTCLGGTCTVCPFNFDDGGLRCGDGG